MVKFVGEIYEVRGFDAAVFLRINLVLYLNCGKDECIVVQVMVVVALYLSCSELHILYRCFGYCMTHATASFLRYWGKP